MDRLDARALAIDLSPRIGLIELDVFGIGRAADDDSPLAARLEPAQDLVFHRETPGVVVLSGLEHRASRRDGVATALELERVEEETIGDVIAGIDLCPDDVARLEVHVAIGTGPDGLQVCGRLARSATTIRLEHVTGQDHAGRAAKSVGPERRGVLEDQLHRVIVQPFDALDLSIGPGSGCRRRHVGR